MATKVKPPPDYEVSEGRPLTPHGVVLGRKRIWDGDNPSDVEKVRNILEEHLSAKLLAKERLTHTGLARALGMTRKTMLDYRKRGDKVSDLISEAITYVEEGLEDTMLEGRNVVGAIFVAKNLGWTDQHDLNVSGDANINIVFDMPTSDYEKELDATTEEAEPERQI